MRLQKASLGIDVLAFAAFVYVNGMLTGALRFMLGGLDGAEIAIDPLIVGYSIPLPQALAAPLFRMTTLSCSGTWRIVFEPLQQTAAMTASRWSTQPFPQTAS